MHLLQSPTPTPPHPNPARYDDLESYSNERSLFLQALRNTIERRWQRWETAQLPAGVAARCAEAGLDEVQQALKEG